MLHAFGAMELANDERRTDIVSAMGGSTATSTNRFGAIWMISAAISVVVVVAVLVRLGGNPAVIVIVAGLAAAAAVVDKFLGVLARSEYLKDDARRRVEDYSAIASLFTVVLGTPAIVATIHSLLLA